MFGLGPAELILILVILVLLFNAGKQSQLVKRISTSVRGQRKGLNDEIG